MIEIEADTTALQAAIGEFAAASGKKPIETILREQAAILTGHLIALTPPARAFGQDLSDRGVVSPAARRRGESTIKEDIAKIFPTTRMRPERADAWVYNSPDGAEVRTAGNRKAVIRTTAWNQADLAWSHKYARNPRTGRTRMSGGANMALTSAAARREYIKATIARVGILAAGWRRAAQDVRTASRAVPAWIRRHNVATGGATLQGTGGRSMITLANQQAYIRGMMESRVPRALARRTHGLRQAMAAMAERAAAQANRRMARGSARRSRRG